MEDAFGRYSVICGVQFETEESAAYRISFEPRTMRNLFACDLDDTPIGLQYGVLTAQLLHLGHPA
jgi:hypothetical protein